jgi:hypothetical protein
MNVRLMSADRDFDPKRTAPWQAAALVQDLGLDAILAAMADNDEFVGAIARTAILTGLSCDLETIRHRQAVIKDIVRQPELAQDLYALAIEAIEGKRRSYFGLTARYPGGILYGSSETMGLFLNMVRKLRQVATDHMAAVESPGLKTLFGTLQAEFSDHYLEEIEGHLKTVKFESGVLVSARLGDDARGTDYRLHQPDPDRRAWWQRLLGQGLAGPGYTFRIPERDETGARVVSDLRDRGLNLAANALAQSTEHMLGFFEQLRAEIAFYIGCTNLHRRARDLGVPVSFPNPRPLGSTDRQYRGLCDLSLALTQGRAVVGNDVVADDRKVIVITGANQGGKSTCLRSLGQAQLMMQAGLFAAAESCTWPLAADMFTHYKREEDETMSHGKLDEELARMSAIVDRLRPRSMVLFNESFASTNEREGSEIAREIVSALRRRDVFVVFVTHLYDFARDVCGRGWADALFLRAERLADGTRTFRVVEGEPEETSYGEDLYRMVFGNTEEHEIKGDRVVSEAQRQPT